MDKSGLSMRSWVTESDIEATVLPEVNRIRSCANIRFALAKARRDGALNPPNREKLIDYIFDAQRDSNGKSDPKRISKLSKLVNTENVDPGTINIYLFPYLGKGSQGNAAPGQRRIFVSQCTDKTRQALEGFPQTAARPFIKGSLSRNVGHELVHILGLKHLDKKY